jgi:hypothetical protein
MTGGAAPQHRMMALAGLGLSRAALALPICISLTLVACVHFEKQSTAPPLVAAERHLARAERQNSNVGAQAGEFFAVAKIAEVQLSSGTQPACANSRSFFGSGSRSKYCIPAIYALIGLAITGLAADPGFEQPGPVDARRFLPQALLESQQHRVYPEAFNDGLVNTYSIATLDGSTEIRGTTALLERRQEMVAIDQLRRISDTQAFKSAVKRSAKQTAAAAKHLFSQPLSSLRDVPEGAKRFTAFKQPDEFGTLCVEVLRNPDLPFPKSEDPFFSGPAVGHEPRDRFASFREHNFLTSSGFLDEPREMSLGRLDVQGLHLN